jgi:hypothetical protein
MPKLSTVESHIPTCVAYDPYQIKSLNDVVYILEHEIDLFDEHQDGCLSCGEIKQVRAALAKVKAL